MRHNYVGDEGDYAKYALLQRLCEETGLLLGVNWYLTEDGDKPSDGLKRRHLTDVESWEPLDPALLGRLRAAVGVPLPELHLRLIEDGAVLPDGTVFFRQPVPGTACPARERAARRAAWHREALEALSAAGIVFLDPDNGLASAAVKSGSAGTRKHAIAAEISDYLQRGQAVVCYQHQPRVRWPDLLRRIQAQLAALPNAPRPAIAKFGSRGFLLLGPDATSQSRLVDAAHALQKHVIESKWSKLPLRVYDGHAPLPVVESPESPTSPVEQALTEDGALTDDDRELLQALYRRLIEG